VGTWRSSTESIDHSGAWGALIRTSTGPGGTIILTQIERSAESCGTDPLIAGTSRAEFIDELAHRRIPVVQVTLEELKEEIHCE
jgi:uncharacterized protein UPF0175